MADVERERVTALWREAAAALESGDYYYDHESGRYVYAPDRSAVDTCAECGRLREQLDAARKERDQVYAVNAAAANDRANAAADALEEIVALCEPNRIPLPLLNSRILRVARAALGVEGEGQA